MKRLTKEEYVCRANIVHNFKYDYSLLEYENTKAKIDIICPIHGLWSTTTGWRHLKGDGCPSCGLVAVQQLQRRRNSDCAKKFVGKASAIHGDTYDYTRVVYKDVDTEVSVKCAKCDSYFDITPNSHLRGRGCPTCGQAKFIKTIYDRQDKCALLFINKAKAIHGDKYEYSQVMYVHSKKRVQITCKIHGEFPMIPNSHLNGQGCPHCKESMGEKNIAVYLDSIGVLYIREHKFPECKSVKPLPFDFYLPEYHACIEFHGGQHYFSVEYFGGEEGFKATQHRDQIKVNYCQQKGIPLLTIPYTDIKKIPEILQEFISTLQKRVDIPTEQA